MRMNVGSHLWEWRQEERFERHFSGTNKIWWRKRWTRKRQRWYCLKIEWLGKYLYHSQRWGMQKKGEIKRKSCSWIWGAYGTDNKLIVRSVPLDLRRQVWAGASDWRIFNLNVWIEAARMHDATWEKNGEEDQATLMKFIQKGIREGT